MTSRERLLTALRNEQPDRVPVDPILFEMVPVRLLGRPSWEPLLYEDPPVWKVRMDAYAYYGVDAVVSVTPPGANGPTTAVVHRTEDRVVARSFTELEGERHWSPFVTVYPRDDASSRVKAETLCLPPSHDSFELVEPAYSKTGRDYFEDARAYVGERGVAAPMVHLPCLSAWPEDAYAYFADPEAMADRIRVRGEAMLEYAREVLSWKPDILKIGNSGMMIFNPPHIFRHLTLEWLQKVTLLAKEHGVPTHLHCCGPETALVQIAAEETELSAIEPLEPPPMGDCDLGEVKRRFGQKLALKGNLHTSSIMLFGTVSQVEDACRRAIDDAAEGGGFILSTGDQVPRDTPDANIEAMLRVADTYGRY